MAHYPGFCDLDLDHHHLWDTCRVILTLKMSVDYSKAIGYEAKPIPVGKGRNLSWVTVDALCFPLGVMEPAGHAPLCRGRRREEG